MSEQTPETHNLFERDPIDQRPGEGDAADAERPGGADVLAGLTAAQREAVTHAGGPLIVLAGPGTGKTRTITARLAHRIGACGLSPDRALALTFTNNAAAQLRERLGDVIGRLAAERVNAGTFHAYALRLLRRFGDRAGVGLRAMLMDSAQRKRLMRRLIVEHGLFPETAGEGVDAAVEMARAAIATMHHAALEPQTAVERLVKRLALLEAESGADADEERARLGRWLPCARLWAFLDEACARAGLLSFDDLLTRAVSLLRRAEDVRSVAQGDARCVVVDEFQDVNATQIELLRLIAPPSALSPPDICVVGDDDQSIYGFRGADDRGFERFERVWSRVGRGGAGGSGGGESRVRTVVLRENFRSSRPVIRAANAVMANAHHRFHPDKASDWPAKWAGEPDAEGAGVEVVRLGSHDSAEVLAAMIAHDRSVRAGAAWKDYAVIVRGGTEADRVAEALRLGNIPVRTSRRPGATQDDGVQDAFAWMKLILSPGATLAVRRLLTRPPCSVDAGRLLAWEQAYLEDRHAAERGAAHAGGGFLGWLVARCGAGEGGVEDGGGDDGDADGFATEAERGAVMRLARLVKELRATAATTPAHGTVACVIRLAGLAHADLLTGRAAARRVRALLDLLNYAREVAGRLPGSGDLRAFLEHYEDLDERDKGFATPSVEDDGEETLAEEADAVAVLTAHAAKGLEFDTVFVSKVQPRRGHFPDRRELGEWDRAAGALEADGELGPGARDATEAMDDEERRVFFVACTRAERRLVLVTTVPKSKSTSVHYALELLAAKAVTVDRTDAQVMAACGAGGEGPDEVERATAADAARAAMERSRAVSRLGHTARAGAAGALERAAAAAEASDEAAYARAQEELVRAAEAYAAARAAGAALARGDIGLPGWVSGLRGAGRAPGVLRDAAEAAREAAQGPVLAQRLTSPLTLSYSFLDAYLRCPRCFYVHRVLKLKEEPTADLARGSLVHDLLQRFVRECRAAEAEGRRGPGESVLLDWADEALEAAPSHGPDGNADERRTVHGLLRNYVRHFHWTNEAGGAGVEVLEVERRETVPYEHGGVVHRLEAKLDRLDRLADGGLRIVDYKTGAVTKSRTSPRGDDLQLGIYALALPAFVTTGLSSADEARGSAEYWMLATGERGPVTLEALTKSRAKLRETIGGVIDGVLAGRYERGERCRGECAVVFGDGPLA